jgi:phytoene dehydrogenase-like protein
MSSPFDQVRMMWRIRKLLRYFGGPFGKPVQDFTRAIHDPWVRFVIDNLFLPEVPVWFVMMLLSLGATGGAMALLADGSLHFARAIERRYLDLGGEVTYRATVEEVLVDSDRAVGVRLADGSTHRAGAVISAADGHSTVFGMLGGRYVGNRTRERYAQWALIRPWVMVSFGVARDLSAEPWSQMIRLEEPIAIGDGRVPWLSVRVFNYGESFAPAGKTVVQAAFDSEWAYWNGLRQRDRAAYDGEKQRVAAEVLERLETVLPGLGSDVEVTDVATPYTTWRYTRNREGAYMGWLPTPKAVTSRVARMLPGLRDFYMAGQWVMPGGGVPPCLASGKHAVQLLCRRDRRAFRVAP